MQTVLTSALLFLTIFVFWANPKEGINKWCSVTLFIFFLGALGEAINIEIIQAFDLYAFEKHFEPFRNIVLWMLHSLTLPTTIVTACYWGYVEIDTKWRLIKYIIFIPSLFLLFFYSPFNTIEYTLTSKSFWITYFIYNFTFGVIVAAIAIRGIILEERLNKEGSLLRKKHNRKKQEVLILLPPLYLTLLAVYPVNLSNTLGLNIFSFLPERLWQLNLLIIPLSIVGAIYCSIYGGGFLGIRIIPDRYNYKLQILADDFLGNFTHRIKNETAYMSVKLDKINDALENDQNSLNTYNEIKSNLNELSEKIQNLNNIANKFSRYSRDIRLSITYWNLRELLNNARRTDVKTSILIDDKVSLECDGSIMTEVFKDIIDNSVQSIQTKNMQEEGEIIITETRHRDKYRLVITDNGVGIPPNKLESIFIPGITTKDREFNSGMGLANCKKMIQMHGGDIFAESEGTGKGAAITITFPYKLVDLEGKNLASSKKNNEKRNDVFNGQNETNFS